MTPCDTPASLFRSPAPLVFSPPAGARQLVYRAVVEVIRGRHNSQVYRTFSHLVNGIGPRLTATPDYTRIEESVIDQSPIPGPIA